MEVCDSKVHASGECLELLYPVNCRYCCEWTVNRKKIKTPLGHGKGVTVTNCQCKQRCFITKILVWEQPKVSPYPAWHRKQCHWNRLDLYPRGLQRATWEKGIFSTPEINGTERFQYLGYSNWTICSPLSRGRGRPSYATSFCEVGFNPVSHLTHGHGSDFRAQPSRRPVVHGFRTHWYCLSQNFRKFTETSSCITFRKTSQKCYS